MGKRKPHFGRPWSRRKVALVGFYSGQGKSSEQIAWAIADGTSSHSIRRQWRRWELPFVRQPGGAPVVFVPVRLNVKLRARLVGLAETRKLSPEEWLRRIVAAAIKDDLFEAIAGDDE